MHRVSWLALLFWLGAIPAFTQPRTNITSGATLPTACNVGDLYIKTGASAGLYDAVATSPTCSWVGPLGTGGGGGTPPFGVGLGFSSNGTSWTSAVTIPADGQIPYSVGGTSFGGFGKWDVPKSTFSLLNIGATTTTLNTRAQVPTIDATDYTPTLASPAAPGNVDAGVHHYKFAVDDKVSGNLTEAGAASSAVTVADASVNGQIDIPVPNYCNSPAQDINLYRDANDGAYKLVAAGLGCSTNAIYRDNVANADLGAFAPTTNTTDAVRLSVIGQSLVPVDSSAWWGAPITRVIGLGLPGDTSLHIGAAPGTPSHPDGSGFTLSAGDGNQLNGSGGPMNFIGGYAVGTGTGGPLTFTGGQAEAGAGGSISFHAGSSDSSTAGEIIMDSQSITSMTDNLPLCRHTDGTIYAGTNVAGTAHCS